MATTQINRIENQSAIHTKTKGQGMRHRYVMALLGGVLALNLSFGTLAHAGVSLNGPDLTGTRIGQQEATTQLTVPKPIQGLGTCAPWDCGVNDPDLTGTRIGITLPPTVGSGGSSTTKLTAPKPIQAGGNCQPWDCGVNGPDLTGTRLGAQEATTQLTVPQPAQGLGICQPWESILKGLQMTCIGF